VRSVTLSTGTKINTLYFAVGQFLAAVSVDNLQRGTFILKKRVNNFGMEISPEKCEKVASFKEETH